MEDIEKGYKVTKVTSGHVKKEDTMNSKTAKKLRRAALEVWKERVSKMSVQRQLIDGLPTIDAIYQELKKRWIDRPSNERRM